MNIHDYVKGAVETESKIDKIESDVPVYATLTLAIRAGDLVDHLKKNVFYGREVKLDTWNALIDEIEFLCGMLRLSDIDNRDGTDYAPYDVNPRLFHAAIGIYTEGAELLENLQKAVDGDTEADRVNFAEELGDNEWYQAIAYDELGVDPEDNFQRNNTKLDKIRYKNKGFNKEDAINRDVDAERKVLEQGV